MASEIDKKRKQFEQAKRDLQVAEKDKKNLPPVVKMPYTPENIHLSKAQFVAKRKKAEQDAAEAREYISKKHSKKEEVVEDVIEDVVEEEVVPEEPKKKKYHRKVVE